MDKAEFNVVGPWARIDSKKHRLNPLSAETVEQLIHHARLGKAPRVLDVGCGTGAWAHTLMKLHPDADYLGIDLAPELIAQGRSTAQDSGYGHRVRFEVADGTAFRPTDTFDLIIMTGLPEQAFGTVQEQLDRFRDDLTEGGSIVYGTGYWVRRPDEAALAVMNENLEDQCEDYPTLVEQVIDAGWLPMYGQRSSTREWDDYQWAFVSACAAELFDGTSHTGSSLEESATAFSHIGVWLRGYDENMGFATFTLRPVSKLHRRMGGLAFRGNHRSLTIPARSTSPATGRPVQSDE